jgi:hypothetical protein
MLRGESLRAPLLAIIHSPGKIITPQPAWRSAFLSSRAISDEEKNPQLRPSLSRKSSHLNGLNSIAKFALPQASPQVYELIPIRRGVAYAVGYHVSACCRAALPAGA